MDRRASHAGQSADRRAAGQGDREAMGELRDDQRRGSGQPDAEATGRAVAGEVAWPWHGYLRAIEIDGQTDSGVMVEGEMISATLQDQIAEVRREIEMRKRTYIRMIDQ